ncbi:MAG: hypothetical protein KDE55_13635 [Novosphingobium sp.]|nr:hypothetical protein [Novosphingobium sp.]
MKFKFESLLLAVFPVRIARLLSPRLRRSIHARARVGFSYVGADSLKLGPHARIGHLNWIRVNGLELSERAYIGHFNQISGSLVARLDVNAGIGNSNGISRSMANDGSPSLLKLGVWSKITASHKVNMADDVIIGDYSTIAGSGSQIWTHGYVHAEQGIDRYRIDGPVEIGNNVYVGSMCFVSMGVRIANGVIVGGGTSVAKDLLEPGLYVSSPIRKLPRPADPDTRGDLERVSDSAGDIVYAKRRTDHVEVRKDQDNA